MRIAQFSFEYPPLSWGGLGTYLKDLLGHLSTRDVDVDLFFVGPEGLDVPHVSVPAQSPQGLCTYTAQDLMARGASNHYDLVVCQDWPGILASQSLWRRGVPLIYTCHFPISWDVGEFKDVPLPRGQDLEFMSLVVADAVIAVSHSLEASLLEDFPVIQGKTHVIHNGTDIDFFSRNVDAAAKPPQASTRLLYVGRFAESKGFDRLPRILHEIRHRQTDARLTVIGTGPMEKRVREELGHLGLSEYVDWLPFSDLSTVRSLMWESAALLVPSRFEPFGLVVTEAMAAELPVIAANTGGPAEILKDGETGFLCEGADAAGYAAAFDRLVRNPRLAQDVAGSAKAHAAARFDKRLNFDRTLDLYRSVATNGPR